jgi:cation:H+ antiporter
MELLYWLVIFSASLFVLLKSADFFIEAAESIGIKFKVPSFIIGATIVAFGTSLPELASSVAAIFHKGEDSNAIIIGNVIGSNISNIFLILGISILVSRAFVIDFKKQKREFLILFLSAVMTVWFLWDLTVQFWEAIVFTASLAAYIAYILIYPHDEEEEEESENNLLGAGKFMLFLVFLISGSLVALGAKYTVEGIIAISTILEQPPEAISLTAVALGTSLPELAVSLSAARRGMSNLILGNIIGSNIFNSFCVLGIPGIISHFTTSDIVASKAVTEFSLPLMMIATILMILLAVKKTTPLYAGLIFILLYVFFIAGVYSGQINLLELVGLA